MTRRSLRAQLPQPVTRALAFISSQLPPLNFITIHYAYFIGVCLLASIIFWGSSTPAKSVNYTDALFLVVSAMTMAGLNTVNLSQLNTFQQVLLFLLLLLGSPIPVSWAVVFVRLKAFERRFTTVVDEQKRKQKERGSLRRRITFRSNSVSKTSTALETEVKGELRGRHDNAAALEKDRIDRADLEAGSQFPPSEEEKANETPPKRGPLTVDTRATGHPSDLDKRDDYIERPNGTRRKRGITFAEPNPLSPTTKVSPLAKILSMQGVGARHDIPNHPLHIARPENLLSPTQEDQEKSKLADLVDLIQHFSIPGMVGRNSHFSGLSIDDRERLGGVEYRALEILIILVPLYYFSWLILAAIGMGAWIANNGRDLTEDNGLNPWWVGAFNAASGFSNSGMMLLDANMVAFQSSQYMLLTVGGLVLAGNTCYPIFLRLILWSIWSLLRFVPATPKVIEYRVTLRFLLDHPRRCYTNLFQSRQTWWLFASLICLNAIDWIAFEILNIGNTKILQNQSPGTRALHGLFQAFAVRSGGFYVVTILDLRIGLLVLYLIMMYISVYPVVITMRSSNVYEERSLGIYDEPVPEPSSDSPNDTLSDHAVNPGSNSKKEALISGLKRRMTVSTDTPASKPPVPAESRGYFVRQQLRGQLAHDLWWVVLAMLFITIIETSSFERDPVTYSVFNIIFEVISAYGTVGLSIGLSTAAYSFSGDWHVASKLILCAVMLRGRHRGLPVAIDRAILLPGDHLAAAEEEDALIREERSSAKTSGLERFATRGSAARGGYDV
ncbi:MAG: hypothetical protein Q9168_002519 [Polycauliona sp. 1 TL-2023]